MVSLLVIKIALFVLLWVEANKRIWKRCFERINLLCSPVIDKIGEKDADSDIKLEEYV